MKSTQTSKYLYVVENDEPLSNNVSEPLHSAGFDVRLFPSVDDLLEATPDGEPDCVIWDMEAPGRTEFEIVESLRQSWRETPVIVISGRADVATAVNAMRSGASDFIAKPFKPKVLLAKIRKFSKRSRLRRSQEPIRPKANPLFKRLTEREAEVLSLLVEGDQNKEVASKLGISPRTVEVYRAKIMHRLRAANFAQLVKLVTFWELENNRPD